MKRDLDNRVKEFLEFRKKFNTGEWLELTRAVQTRLNEKAAKLELDDLDIQIIEERILRNPFL